MKIARLSFLRLGYAGSIVLIVVSTVGSGARADHFGPDQAGVVADADDDVDAGDAAAGRAGKDCGDAGGTAGADAIDDGRAQAAKPTSSTVKSCVASTMTPTDLLNQAQQKGGMTCKFTNQQVTASAISFDISCTTTQGTASGHAQFTMADSEHRHRNDPYDGGDERERTFDECDHGRHVDLYVPGRGLRRREAGFPGGSDGAVSAQPRPEV
jgi:hypothetical protein